MKKYEYSLLALCESVHMAATGAGEDPSVGLMPAINELSKRLEDWDNNPEVNKRHEIECQSASNQGKCPPQWPRQWQSNDW